MKNKDKINNFYYTKYFFIIFAYFCVVFTGLWLGYFFVIHGNFFDNQGQLFSILASRWDAGWYQSIARTGYHWNHNFTQQQNIAFFPLYPVIERFIFITFSSWNGIFLILPAVFFGMLSIIMFYYLADLIFTNKNAAFVSTLAFALYPGSIFYVTAYPVSIMNFLTILVLILLIKKKYWLAALAAGINTAAGPLPIFLSISVFIAYVFDQYYKKYGSNLKGLIDFKNSARIFALGLLSISGILLFIIYQFYFLNSPLAFIDAQKAWDSISFLQHIKNVLNFYTIFGRSYTSHGFFLYSLFFSPLIERHPDEIQIGFEHTVNGLTIVLLTYLIWQQRKVSDLIFTIFGFILIAGFIYLHGSIVGPSDSIRLLYIAIPAFLGVGVIYKKAPLLSYAMILVFSLLLLLQTAFFISGYWIN